MALCYKTYTFITFCVAGLPGLSEPHHTATSVVVRKTVFAHVIANGINTLIHTTPYISSGPPLFNRLRKYRQHVQKTVNTNRLNITDRRNMQMEVVLSHLCVKI